MMPLCQWHQRLLLSRSFLLRAAIFCGGRRRSDLCRSISSAVFVFQATLGQNCNHCHECIRGTSPAIASRRIMSSRSGGCGRSQRLFRYRERGVSLTQKRFSSDDKNYRRSDPVPEEEEEPERQNHNDWAWLPLFAALTTLAYLWTPKQDPIPEVSFPFFLQHMLYTGEVDCLEVGKNWDRVYIYLHPGAIVNGKQVRSYSPQFMLTISSVDSLEAKLNQAQDDLGIPHHGRVSITYRSNQDTGFWSLMAFSGLLAAWFLYIAQRRGSVKIEASIKFNPFDYIKQAKTTVITNPSQISASFADVAGMEEAKLEVTEFVDYLKNPDKYTELGARIPKGALLHGPPGTGKTLLARAIAAEAKVPFLSIAGSDFVEIYAGVGSARVRDLFKQARKHAPCIVYIDEVDAVGRSRGRTAVEGHQEQENTLNQLLVEMDGIDPLEGVVMLASTNRVDILDQALLRPGRFDRQILINLPTLPERKAIFEVYLKKILLEKSVDAYSSRLAALTPGHSGADIANIVNEATLHAARFKGAFVTERDFEYAIERVIAGMEKKSNVMSPAESRVVAFHEAGHALTGWMLEHTDPIMKVSIVPRTKGALEFAQYLPSDQKLYTTEQLFDRMCMTLGGRAAEAITFRKITTGAQDDLDKVTQMAYRQVVEFGMSPTIGHISLPHKKPSEPAKRMYSDKLARMIDEEVKSIVDRAYNKAESLLKENATKLSKLAECLLEREVLNYKDIVEILGPLPLDKKFHHHHEFQDMWCKQ